MNNQQNTPQAESDEAAAERLTGYLFTDKEDAAKFQKAFIAGCQHVRQQLSPIMCGEKVITQELFNRMYAHYSELLTLADTAGFWNEQFEIANKERNDLRQQLSAQKGDEINHLQAKVNFYRAETQKLRDYINENKLGKPNQKLFDVLYEHITELKSQLSAQGMQKDALLDEIAARLKETNAIIRSIMPDEVNPDDAKEVNLYHNFHFNNDILARYNQLKSTPPQP